MMVIARIVITLREHGKREHKVDFGALALFCFAWREVAALHSMWGLSSPAY